MKFAIKSYGGETAYISVFGDLTSTNAARRLRAALDSFIGQEYHHVDVDLAGAGLFGAEGVKMLAEAAVAARHAGSTLRIHASPAPTRIARATRLRQALRSLAKQAGELVGCGRANPPAQSGAQLSNLKGRLIRGAQLLSLIDRRRTETGLPVGLNVERLIVQRELDDLAGSL